MKTRSVLSAIACAAIFSATLVAADVNLEKIKCVVNGKKSAKAEQSVDYKEGKVYFCCGNCPKAFAKDTAKFAARANHQLVGTKQYKQKACPISGQPCKADIAVKVGGVKVAFCCEMCQGKVKEAKGLAAKAELTFSDKAFEKGFEVAKKKGE